ncbi:hypothetical protein DBIPINDM_008469 (plasmid) [Mesorhizobium sp. AR02]|uniref:hypothetical protein n=1 Tax=Mesorhizobium sp. AR02 TaxID=2865837 RepID=UPI0021608A11|nr:hypothetical protein [Mesorhizobium sp. AR02]UVK57493.1 hypothetical protein DBIPINDM_008469 [Mesorhizobium sp. AR02]
MLARMGTSRGTIADPRVKALCDEFAVRIVGSHLYPQPGETRAVGTIRRIIDRHGVEHARLVLCVLAEGKGNNALIDETSLWAISDLLRACPDLVEGKTTALLEMFDELPLGPMMAMVNELRGVVHQRHALAGMIYLYARQLRPAGATFKVAGPGKMRKARISEGEKRAA